MPSQTRYPTPSHFTASERTVADAASTAPKPAATMASTNRMPSSSPRMFQERALVAEAHAGALMHGDCAGARAERNQPGRDKEGEAKYRAACGAIGNWETGGR